MENNQSELEFEKERLEQTISLARKHLIHARQSNEENKSAILSAKAELRENTTHSVSNLWSAEGFEALAALSQYANPVTDKIEEFEAIENKILHLENLIKSPYFARVDFKFEDEDVFEKIYIGRTSLMDNDTYDILIYDWRSPIASVFYRFVLGEAYYEAPNGRITGEMNLKRQYEIKNGALEYYFDADVQIVDEFLRKMLSQNTSPKMKTIVETIQREQDIIIRDMDNDLMMVQGVAGSGKTSIALHRAAYLMYQGLSARLSANNIIIISPNTLFEEYISHVLPELGEDNIVSVVFDDIMASILQNKSIQSKNQFLECLITSPGHKDMIKQSIAFKTSPQFLEILNRFIEDIPRMWMDFEDVRYGGNYVMTKDEIKNKILSGRKETPLELRLMQLEDFILESIQEPSGKPIKKSELSLIKKELQHFMALNIIDLYRKLFADKAYFYNLAHNINLPGNIEDIMLFTKENLSSPVLYYDDAIALTYFSIKIKGFKEYKHIKQVVIDEAQDYYPLQYEIFNLLFSNAKFTVLGDINQTLEKQEDLTLYETVGRILSKKKASLVTMDKSFRCTNEILTYSGKFIEQSHEAKSFNRGGDEPAVFSAPDTNGLHNLIISEINTCIEKGYQTIGLLCKSERNAQILYQGLKDSIDVKLIKNESTANLQGVFIIPVYMSKGLEFDAVLICDANDRNYNSRDDKKLLYIGCTRALHRLNLFSEGAVSPLL